jgi:hypothetical protein
VSALCNLAVKPDRKVRRRCPRCRRRESARLRECYDTVYLFFACGVAVDLGAGEWWDDKAWKE